MKRLHHKIATSRRGTGDWVSPNNGFKQYIDRRCDEASFSVIGILVALSIVAAVMLSWGCVR